jgi:ribosome-interacting GTPase 1
MTEIMNLVLQMINAAAQGKKVALRKRGKKLVVVQLPVVDKNRVPTPAQKNQQARFSAASVYAKEAMANSELEKTYREKATYKRSATKLAFMDYLRAPEVKRIDAKEYNGKKGSTIQIKAKDDFSVKEVKVSIYNARGVLKEEGNAIQDPIMLHYWIYTATRRIQSLQGLKIKAVARDLANNTGELEISL